MKTIALFSTFLLLASACGFWIGPNPNITKDQFSIYNSRVTPTPDSLLHSLFVFSHAKKNGTDQDVMKRFYYFLEDGKYITGSVWKLDSIYIQDLSDLRSKGYGYFASSPFGFEAQSPTNKSAPSKRRTISYYFSIKGDTMTVINISESLTRKKFYIAEFDTTYSYFIRSKRDFNYRIIGHW
jgi:hypothetical protein